LRIVLKDLKDFKALKALNDLGRFDQADAYSKMLTLGIVCKQPLPSLTRICDVR